MPLNLKTYQTFGGAIIAPPTLIATTYNCAIGYDFAELLFDTATNQPLVGLVNATTIVCSKITDKCTGLTSIVVGDYEVIKQAIENPCCILFINSANFVNLLGDTTFPALIGTNVNYPKVALIDLTAYGGTIVPVANDQEIVKAFANLPAPIIVQVVNGQVFFPINYTGDIADVEVSGSLINATITITNNPDEVTIDTTAIKSNGGNPTPADQVRLIANMNNTTLDTNLITWGDTAAMVALDWASVGLTNDDGTPLNSGNFVWSGGNFNIINAYKNASVIANHPTMAGNPLLYKPIPDINKAFPITIDYTFYENFVVVSNTATDVVIVQKYLEYASAVMSKAILFAPPHTKGSTVIVYSNAWINQAGVVPFITTVDGAINAPNYNPAGINQANDYIDYRYIDDNLTDTSVGVGVNYVFPYSNQLATIKANNFIKTGLIDAFAESYNYAFLTNNSPNQPTYTLFWHANPVGSMNQTDSIDQTLTLDGSIVTPSLGTTSPNPRTNIAPNSFLTNENLDLLSLAQFSMHELRMDVTLTGPDVVTPFAKYATTQFYISNR